MASKLRHRERPAARQRRESQEHRTVDDELGDNDRKRGNALEGEHQVNDTALDHQPRAAPSRLNPCIQGFEFGVNCAAAAAIMALAGKISAPGIMSLPQRGHFGRAGAAATDAGGRSK